MKRTQTRLLALALAIALTFSLPTSTTYTMRNHTNHPCPAKEKSRLGDIQLNLPPSKELFME